VCVAGIPMMNGSAALEGYVPEIDATVVTRTLAAGYRMHLSKPLDPMKLAAAVASLAGRG